MPPSHFEGNAPTSLVMTRLRDSGPSVRMLGHDTSSRDASWLGKILLILNNIYHY